MSAQPNLDSKLPEIITRRFNSDTAYKAALILWNIEKGEEAGVTTGDIRKHTALEYQAIKYLLRRFETLSLIDVREDEYDARAYRYSVSPLYRQSIGSLRHIFQGGPVGGIGEGDSDGEYSFMFFNSDGGNALNVNDLLGALATSTEPMDRAKTISGLFMLMAMEGRGINTGLDPAVVKSYVKDTRVFLNAIVEMLDQLLVSSYMDREGRAGSEIYSVVDEELNFTGEKEIERTGWHPDIALDSMRHMLQDERLKELAGPKKLSIVEMFVSKLMHDLTGGDLEEEAD